MNNMRKLINLMEGVMAVPGLGPNAGGSTESDMQTTGTIGRNQAYGEFDAAQGGLDEKAPPGKEKLVRALKKEYPGHEDKAFATAWSIYNKEHGKKDEGCTTGMEESVPAVASCNQDNPEDCRTACAMENVMEQSQAVEQALKSFESAVMSYGMAPEEAYDRISQQLGDEDLEAFRNALEAQGFQDMADAETMDLEPTGSFDMSDDAAALASAGHGSDEDYYQDGSDFEFDEAYDLNNGYSDVELANGGDYFPNGADSPVVKATGPSGARQGDNPEQKKMQVAETHRELVYAYRNYLKESAK